MNFIQLKNLTKVFDNNEAVVKNINLTINKNEFVTLLGPSGCGKTTILRMIGGFTEVTSGQIILDEEDITNLAANHRKINTVFQNYALFPHLNVFENIAFGLKVKKLPPEEIKQKVDKVLTLVKLTEYQERKIKSLSGGQKQRVAVARAIINEPKLLLLDEPLSALDLKLRQELQYELKDMQKHLEITFLFVTHDQEEALTMSDRIVVINNGEIQQIGTPESIYNEPKNKFVAAFIGESNIIAGQYLGSKKVKFFDLEFECVDTEFALNEKVDVVIRPEDFDVVSSEKAKIVVKVDDIVFKGVHYEVIAYYGDFELVIHTLEHLQIGKVIGLTIDPFEIHLMKTDE